MNPFVQLLSGVVWLIRNGSIYINESQATECDETQETGQGAEALFTLCVQGAHMPWCVGEGQRRAPSLLSTRES